ncbi:hypothetical protein DPMN_141139 [Dreissena polymorpha]|uniref:Uncharacterized protein n=1 Tax=Dreissena polymorpha TaxID=45954 RepID=A0A9D4G8U8_DREPO|nr:hypothetical protein DPMN_141139 [Dreissena polymorpha]
MVKRRNRTPFVCVPCRERPPVEVMDVSLCDDSISESESDNESVPESDHESVPEPGKETESETVVKLSELESGQESRARF